MTYEGPSYGGRRILDSSPAVVRLLDIQSWGWASSTLVYVEWTADKTRHDGRILY